MVKIRSLLDQLPAPGESARWYAYRTGFKREKIARKRLAARGFEVYLPLRLVVKRYRSKTTTAELPLFSNYLFVRTTAADYAKILADPDVFEIVQFNGEVGRVAEDEIALLKAILGSDREAFDARVHEGLVAGDPVVVTGGTLAGTRGYVLADRENSTFLVELRALGVGLEINVDARYLARDTK